MMRKTSLLIVSGAFLFLLILTILIFNKNLYKSEKESLLLYPNFSKSLEKMSKISIYHEGKKYDLIKKKQHLDSTKLQILPCRHKKDKQFFYSNKSIRFGR